MLAIFTSAIIRAPEELIHAGIHTPTPKKPALDLIHAFLTTFPSSVSMSINSLVHISFTHDNESSLYPRLLAVKDDIFCMFEGCLENLTSLRQQYGLGKKENEVVLVMEAYRALRDRAPYPTSSMLGHLSGGFSFIIFDKTTSTVFVASVRSLMDQDGRVPLFLGITSDGYIAFSNDSDILRGVCGRSLASFPSGCFFSSSTGLKSYEHPKNKITAVPAMEEDVFGATFKIEGPNAKETAEYIAEFHVKK